MKNKKSNTPKEVVQVVKPVYNNRKYYVFTNWGLVKGLIVDSRIDRETGVPQFKLVIDIDRNNKGVAYNFWYLQNELNKFYATAIITEAFKPLFRGIRNLIKG